MIGCKLFALTKESQVRDGVKQLFRSLLQTLSGWLAQVLRSMKDSAGSKGYSPEARVELRDRAMQIAAACRTMYKLEDATADMWKYLGAEHANRACFLIRKILTFTFILLHSLLTYFSLRTPHFRYLRSISSLHSRLYLHRLSLL